MQQQNKISESESHELALDSYVMHVQGQLCTHCGTIEKWSQIFEVWLHPTKSRTTGFKELRPIRNNSNLKPLKLACIWLGARHIPHCQACFQQHKSVDQPKTVTNSEWQETLKRKYAAPAPQERVATRSTPVRAVPTLDEL